MAERMLYISPELAAVYPNATRAILLVENEITNSDPRDFWAAVRGFVDKKGLDSVIDLFSSICHKHEEEKDFEVNSTDPNYMANAATEFHSQDFRRYIMAKLGMM